MCGTKRSQGMTHARYHLTSILQFCPPPHPCNGRIFEMIDECTSYLLKHLEKTFSKASNCLKNKIQKTNCIQKSIKMKKKHFRCWSILTPFDRFYLGNILWMVTGYALNQQMSRSGPESGRLVLKVDQKKWSVFKTDKQKQIKK